MAATRTSARGPAARREVARRRLAALRIAPTDRRGAAAIADRVRSLLALQAQDLSSGYWSIGLRTGASLADVQAAVDARLITRSWPMRGTLHFLATEDVRWMCRLLNDPTNAGLRARWAELEITDAVLDAARGLVIAALTGGRRLSRPAAMDLLRANGISPDGQRGLHILSSFCRDGLLCQGPPDGRQATFVLLEEWVPWSFDPGREEAMATLAQRYVLSHGPVTERDVAGWIGKPLAFTRESLALAGDQVARERIGGTTFLVHVDAPAPAPRPGLQLLPGFDEYLLGYKDRSAMLTAQEQSRVVPGGNGVFLSTVVAGGQVIGTWTRRVTDTRVEITLAPFDDLTPTHRRDVERAAAAYGAFLGLPAEVTVQTGSASSGPRSVRGVAGSSPPATGRRSVARRRRCADDGVMSAERGPVDRPQLEELVDRARTELRQWTDASDHDPGVALLQLFAFVGDLLSSASERLAADSHLGTGRPDLVQVEVDGHPWQQVTELAGSGAQDPHFVVGPGDGGALVLAFGDDEHGRRPPSDSSVRVRYRQAGAYWSVLLQEGRVIIDTDLGDGPVRGACGVYRAIVLDDADPLGLRRLLVRIPDVSGDERVWAAACLPLPDSQEAPAVGDGVWIALEAGDPARPIWLGQRITQ